VLAFMREPLGLYRPGVPDAATLDKLREVLAPVRSAGVDVAGKVFVG